MSIYTAPATSATIADGSIVDADVNATAAIAGTKVSPNFGSQTVQTTGVFSHALGTAAAPTVAFTGDPNTGIYSPGADQVAISTNGTGRLFVSATGQVGIGTSAPQTDLQVGSGTITPGEFTGASIQHLYNPGLMIGAPASTGLAGRINFATDGGIKGRILYDYASNFLRFDTNGVERFRCDSSGRVGIGTSSPGSRLEVSTTTDVASDSTLASDYSLAIWRPTGALNGQAVGVAFGIYNAPNGSITPGAAITHTRTGTNSLGSLEFKTKAGTSTTDPCITRMVIDSSGRLLVGTSSARTLFTGYTPTLQVEASTAGVAGVSIVNTESAVGGPVLFLAHSRGANGLVSNGDDLGGISFHGGDGTNLQSVGASIVAKVDGAPGAADMPGRLVFSTTADGASSPTERLRITSTGQVRLAGAGITFNGDTATANELDDYEEGTFTPTIFGATTGGTTTYSAQNGRYTKVGRVVHVQIFLDWTAATGTGAMRIGGLPFTASSDATYPAFAIGDVNNIALTANNVVLVRVEPSTNNIYFAQYPVGGGASTVVGVDTAGFITLAGSYIV